MVQQERSVSEVPSYANSQAGAARARLSASSITGFVLGLLFCVPVITSVLALLFSIVGMRATRGGDRSGRGFAIAGLVLGIIGLVLWGGVGAFTAFLISASAPARAVLHDFASDLAANNKPAALAISTISSDDFDKLHTYLAPFGAYRDLTCTSVNIGKTFGVESCSLNGTASFAGGSHPFFAVVTNSGGTWKVAGFRIW